MKSKKTQNNILNYTIAFLTFVIIGCSSNENDGNNGNYKMSADINGLNKSAAGYFSMEYRYDLGYHVTNIYTLNPKFEDDYISIGLTAQPKLGIYNFNNEGSTSQIDGASLCLRITDENNITYYYYSVNGSVNITKFSDKNIIGTFECTVYCESTNETLVITNGKINNFVSAVSGMGWNGL